MHWKSMHGNSHNKLAFINSKTRKKTKRVKIGTKIDVKLIPWLDGVGELGEIVGSCKGRH